ncbi:hypothetical protein [Cryobacterium sp. GrIS_2_6]|nr:hypothetical protein [Cryobacterium psychrotolerans]
MPELLSIVAVFGGIAAVLAGLIALAARARRRGVVCGCEYCGSDGRLR